MKKLVLAILIVCAFTEKSTAQNSKYSYTYEQAYDLIKNNGCQL